MENKKEITVETFKFKIDELDLTPDQKQVLIKFELNEELGFIINSIINSKIDRKKYIDPIDITYDPIELTIVYNCYKIQENNKN